MDDLQNDGKDRKILDEYNWAVGSYRWNHFIYIVHSIDRLNEFFEDVEFYREASDQYYNLF